MLLALLYLALSPAALSGQTLFLEGTTTDAAFTLLEQIVERGDYELIDRDTVLPADFVLTSDLVIIGARVALEGRIEGRVGLIASDLFLRPGSSIQGPIATIAADVHPSGSSEAGTVLASDPRLIMERSRTAAGHRLEITKAAPGRLLTFPGISGFALPTYDRVNGVSLYWSAGLWAEEDTSPVQLRGRAVVHLERRTLGGGVEARYRPSANTRATLRASRTTRTSDAWIRGDLANSLSALFFASDLRNYYSSDVLRLEIARLPPAALVAGEGFLAPRLDVQLSRDRSLPTGDPYSIFRGEHAWRENPQIDEGVLASLTAGASGAWRGPTTRFDATIATEWAPPGIGDFHFAQLRASARGRLQALFRHEISISGHLLLPIASEVLPRQRWSFLGGQGTLPTFETASMRGDHLLFLESEYSVPLRRLRLPLLGVPALSIKHASGAVWVGSASRPELEQNLGIGLKLSFFDAMFYIDPAGPLEPIFTLGSRLPTPPGIF